MVRFLVFISVSISSFSSVLLTTFSHPFFRSSYNILILISVLPLFYSIQTLNNCINRHVFQSPVASSIPFALFSHSVYPVQNRIDRCIFRSHPTLFPNIVLSFIVTKQRWPARKPLPRRRLRIPRPLTCPRPLPSVSIAPLPPRAARPRAPRPSSSPGPPVMSPSCSFTTAFATTAVAK